MDKHLSILIADELQLLVQLLFVENQNKCYVLVSLNCGYHLVINSLGNASYSRQQFRCDHEQVENLNNAQSVSSKQ